jgi:hypothetical protein
MLSLLFFWQKRTFNSDIAAKFNYNIFIHIHVPVNKEVKQIINLAKINKIKRKQLSFHNYI